MIGPGWETLARTGDKLAARQLASESNVPVLQALNTPTNDIAVVKEWARSVGFPIIAKAVDGGGGRGIRIVRKEDELESLVERALRESPQGLVFAEKAAVDGYRHVEVQIIGDGHGNVRHLWERECSVQRRFQKVVEFAPSSIKDRNVVAEVIEAALRMARKVRYLSLGTFEFLVHESRAEFWFLEVNPRLQVEHTITESLVPGLDLVKIQLLVAQGVRLDNLMKGIPVDPRVPPPLYSIQLRICAENASADWSLSVGKISSLSLPSGHGIRVDTHLVPGLVVKTDFDSLLAKVIITTRSWDELLIKARRALDDTNISGIVTTLPALRGIISSPAFVSQKCDTRWLESSLSSVLIFGDQITSQLPKSEPSAVAPTSLLSAQSGAIFRRGDQWSVTLTPAGSKEAAPSGHFQITKVLRNDFPTSIAADIVYTPPSAPAQAYTMALQSTTASANSLTAGGNHRQGDKSNPDHAIIPFPGQLVEICADEGDYVEKNDVIAVVKQMKMELEIRSSKAGVVEWIYEGEEDDEVSEGTLLAVVKDAGKTASKL